MEGQRRGPEHPKSEPPAEAAAARDEPLPEVAHDETTEATDADQRQTPVLPTEQWDSFHPDVALLTGSGACWEDLWLGPPDVVTGPDADESVRGSLSPEPTDDQRNELTRLIEERPWESDPEAALLTESESGWEDYGPQFLRSGIEAPGNPDAHQQADDAVTRAQADPEKVGHIFDNPTHDHQWEATGLDLEDNWNLIRETIEVNYSQIPDNGVYEVMQVFGSFTVSVRGAVVGGAVRIGTAWVNEL